MATRRIKEITNTATTFASDDFIALDGTTQGTRKMDKDDLIAEVSAGVSGDYLEEANNLSDVASLDTSKLNMEIPDVGTAPNEVPLNGQLGSMAYQDADSVSMGQAQIESTTGTATTQALTVTDGTDDNFVVQEGGNVGVGLSSPSGSGWDESSTVLHVKKGDTSGGLLALESSNTKAILNAGNNQLAVFTTTADPIRLGTSGSEAVRIDSSQRVGIGDASPGGKLTIETGSGNGLQLYRSAANANFDAITFRDTTNSATNGRIGFNANELRLEGTNEISLNTGGSEAVTIDSSQRVGINQAAPGTFYAGANNLVIGDHSAANQGLTIASGASNYGLIYFSDTFAGTGLYRGSVFYNHNLDTLGFSSAGTTQWTINSSGNLVAGTGNGIDFGTTTSGSGTVSGGLLDDFESGTFVPSLQFGGGETGITYSSRSGYYTKVGKLVTVHYHIVLTSKGTSTGNAGITGGPFVSAFNAGGQGVSVIHAYSMASLSSTPFANQGMNSNTLSLWDTVATGRDPLTDANFTNTTGIDCTLTFEV